MRQGPVSTCETGPAYLTVGLCLQAHVSLEEPQDVEIWARVTW
jgi:hypothetical protein